jgi:hypothetical protein
MNADLLLLARIVEPTIEIYGRMKGLSEILGVMGEDPCIDQDLGLDHLIVRPLPVLGEGNHQALCRLRDRVWRVSNVAGTDTETVS